MHLNSTIYEPIGSTIVDLRKDITIIPDISSPSYLDKVSSGIGKTKKPSITPSNADSVPPLEQIIDKFEDEQVSTKSGIDGGYGD